ncbi:MAG: hypothetical protein ACXQS2_00660, partial [Methermicoccaceae archaeon]
KNVVVVVMLNYRTGITGKQLFSEAKYIKTIASGLCESVHTIIAENSNEQQLQNLLNGLIKKGGVHVILIEGECV